MRRCKICKKCKCNIRKTKRCSRCSIEKPIKYFGINRTKPDGFEYYCKKCVRTNAKKRYYKNRENILIRQRIYQRENREELNRKKRMKRKKIKNKFKKERVKDRAYLKLWKREHKDRVKKYGEKYYIKNREKIKISELKYRKKNKDRISERTKRYYQNNKESIQIKRRIYKEKNPEVFREYGRKRREKIKNNPRMKLKLNVSQLINKKLKNRLLNKNYQSTFSFLPYTIDELMNHLEKYFESWMNWKNYGKGKGKWNIDHVIPDSHFNYTSVNDLEFQKCWALENLRPMDANENCAKQDRYPYKK